MKKDPLVLHSKHGHQVEDIEISHKPGKDVNLKTQNTHCQRKDVKATRHEHRKLYRKKNNKQNKNERKSIWSSYMLHKDKGTTKMR